MREQQVFDLLQMLWRRANFKNINEKAAKQNNLDEKRKKAKYESILTNCKCKVWFKDSVGRETRRQISGWRSSSVVVLRCSSLKDVKNFFFQSEVVNNVKLKLREPGNRDTIYAQHLYKSQKGKGFDRTVREMCVLQRRRKKVFDGNSVLMWRKKLIKLQIIPNDIVKVYLYIFSYQCCRFLI